MASDQPGKFKALTSTIKATARTDRKFLPIVLGAALGTLAVFVVLGILLDSPILFSILGVLLALLVAVSITGRRASAAAFSSIEGQPGAAAAVLSSMRGNWRVQPAVALTRQQDCVHRVVGRPGIVLVAEGSGSRPRELLSAELRKVRRVAGDTPVYDLVVGDGAGQVPLRRLQVHVMKLPRNLKPKDVNAVEARLRAIGGAGVPLPKGPLPTRVPRGRQR